MSEILFVANDPRILALIENLQSLTEARLGVEAEFSNGIRRIFDEHPAIVFLQSTIDEVSCEKLANHVKMLLDTEAIRLVLLSDVADSSCSLISTFDSCFDINLPLDELSRQIREMFPSLCEPSREEPIADEIPAIDLTDDPFGEFPSAIEAWNNSGQDVHIPTMEELEGSSTPAAEMPEFPPDEDPQFRNFLDCCHFDIDPLVALPETNAHLKQPSHPELSSSNSAAVSVQSVTDFHRIEKAHPNLLFDSLADAPVEPPTFSSKPGRHKPGGTPTSGPATVGRKGDSAKADGKAASSKKSVVASMTTQRIASATLDDFHDSMAAGTDIGIGMNGTRYYRGVVICALLVVCLASTGLFIKWRYGATSLQTSKTLDHDVPVSASQSSTMQQLPLFIPLTAQDAAYAATHPGWERYSADGLTYLVYREKGRIRAIQLLSEERGAITLPFLKTCIRVATGYELSATKTSEARGDFKVVTGSLPNGADVATYRKVSDGEIMGFVLCFPANGQAAPGDAKGATR